MSWRSDPCNGISALRRRGRSLSLLSPAPFCPPTPLSLSLFSLPSLSLSLPRWAYSKERQCEHMARRLLSMSQEAVPHQTLSLLALDLDLPAFIPLQKEFIRLSHPAYGASRLKWHLNWVIKDDGFLPSEDGREGHFTKSICKWSPEMMNS